MISSLHLKLARTALGLNQVQVAKQSSISLPTIKKIETTNPNGEIKSNKSTIIALMKFFEDNGVEFIDDKIFTGIKIAKKTIKQKFKNENN